MKQKAILYGINLNKISSKEAIHILQNPKEDLISTIPPVEPKGGEIYLISDEGDEKRRNDWSHDSYQWVNKGGDGYPRQNAIVWRKTYNISTKVADKIGSSGFQRVSFRLTTKSPFVLVHYIGDESIYVPKPHGNQKSNVVRNFISTMPSVLSKI